MSGFITEAHLRQAETVFPGIARFYAQLMEKPATFLNLLCLWHKECDRCRPT